MTQSTRIYLGLMFSSLTLLCAGCEQDDLQTLTPAILVCVTEAAEEGDCELSIELGERFLGIEYPFELYIHNIGDAPLAVADVSSSTGTLAADPSTATIPAREFIAVTVTLTPDTLGEQIDTLTLTSDDPQTPELALGLRYTGVPAPTPAIALCTAAGDELECAPDITVDFGTVRRTQDEQRDLVVRNEGTDTLVISEVIIERGSSLPGEMSVLTSTRPGSLAPGEQAPVLLGYAPLDSGEDTLTLRFDSNDPENPTAIATVVGFAEDNEPPVALPVELFSGLADATGVAGHPVYIDGRGSSDPEGDPLEFMWTLIAPESSLASLQNTNSGLISFVPDLAGLYRIDLVVVDSLGAESESVTATIAAEPGTALRANVSWSTGGDVDIHLVPAGAALFSEEDCYFENPNPDMGEEGLIDDDPMLLGDAESAVGLERLVFADPPDGEYELWAHYWNDAATGEAAVSAAVTLFDASFPTFEGSATLTSTCDAWPIGTVTFPEGTFTPASDPVTSICPVP